MIEEDNQIRAQLLSSNRDHHRQLSAQQSEYESTTNLRSQTTLFTQVQREQDDLSVIKEQPTSYMGIQVKKHADLRNLLAIPSVFAIFTMVSAYINAQIVFLLRSNNYPQIQDVEVGAISSSILFWSMLLSILVLPFIGYSYELLGRRLTIGIAFLLIISMIYTVPYCAPNVEALGVVRLLMTIGLMTLSCHPLVADYVKKNSRGKATALQALGTVSGEMFAIVVLINITVTMTSVQAFTFTGSVILAICLLTLLLISEPKLKRKYESKFAQSTKAILQAQKNRKSSDIDDRDNVVNEGQTDDQANFNVNDDFQNPDDNNNEQVKFDEMNGCEKLKILSIRLCEVLGSDVRYIAALLCSMVIKLVAVLFSVYLILWITSFIDVGVLESDAQAALIYSKMALISVTISGGFVPVAGYIADKVSPRYVIPTAFLMRAVVVLGFLQLSRPDTFWAFFFCSSMMVLSMFEVVSIELLYLKKLPSDIRGVMTSLFGLFGMLGTLIFTFVASVIFEDFGPASPFYVVGVCDIVIALFVITLSCFGKLKD